ncbi:MAG TPA: LptF/LptG family permease, partial [Acidobacteriota bacterium]|nr:LptF/LptG family permease [Acidobacteriota bacterium]
MRRINKIVLQEINGPIVVSLLVLTFVVFTREFGRLAQLLIQKNADTTIVFSVVLYLTPSILIFTVPFAFLIGTLIGFSRLSADSEIVALRAGGVSVFQLLRPVFMVGLVVMALTAMLTLYLLPAGNWNLRTLRHELRVLPVQSQIKPRVFYEEFPGLVLYIEDLDPQQSLWKGILVADTSTEGEHRLILAKQGYPLFSSDRRRLQLHFENGTIFTAPFSFPERDDVSSFGTLDIPVDLPYEEEPVERPKRAEDKTLQEILEDLRTAPPEERHTSLVELNRRLALPIAALIFSVLGVTLGIRSHRGGRGYGFVASVVVAFIYYVLFATGSTLSNNGVLPIPVGVWGANILLGIFALLTLKYATRETGLWSRLPRIGVPPVLSR